MAIDNAGGGWRLRIPPVSLVRRYDTHRLIPSKFSAGGERVLARVASDRQHLNDIFDLDNATNGRLLAESGILSGIGAHELVFGAPCYRIVNAAFTHAHPLGSRFNGPDRGARDGVPTYRTPEQAAAIFEVVDAFRDRNSAAYGPAIQAEIQPRLRRTGR